MRKFTGAVSVIALVACTTSSFAGGFQRGTADTDILFESGTFSSRFGVTYVNPNRGFSSINGVEGDYGDYTGIYLIPSAAVAYGRDDLACAGTMTEAFAAEADYDGGLPRQVSSTDSTSNEDRLDFANATTTSSTSGIEFKSYEFGATCRVSYSTENSRFSLLGGLFVEDFQFEGQSLGQRYLTPAIAADGSRVVLPSSVDVDTSGGTSAAYRIGFAYEIPDIALRAQVMYRSEVEHDDIVGTGTVTITDSPFIIGPDFVRRDPGNPLETQILSGTTAAVTGAGFVPGAVIPVTSYLSNSTSPQSITINAQTGIAEGTLLLASFRWTDWSTNENVVSSISSLALGNSSSYSPYRWDDGYTASIGIGRAFTNQISVAVSLGYDSGVSTGAETTYTDLYTVSGGVSFKPNTWGELRLGGLVGYWTDGEQRIEDGAFFDAEVDATIVYAGNLSLKLSF